MITFTVPGRPVPTARPRVLRSGRTYLPTRTRQAQLLVREHALAACKNKTPFFPTQALSVAVVACFAYAKGTPKKRILPGWVPMPQTPDLDNLAKTVLDGCNTILWRDDAQIVELTVSKWRVENTEDEGFHCEVEALTYMDEKGEA